MPLACVAATSDPSVEGILSEAGVRFVRSFDPYVRMFMALGGVSYAALTVTGKNVKNNSLTGKDVKNRSLTKRDLKGSLRGRKGATGATGPAGVPGASGSALAFARIDGDTATVEFGEAKNLTNANVVRGSPTTGVFCFGGIVPAPTNVIVSLANDIFELNQSASIGGTTFELCPPTHQQANVVVYDRDTLENGDFYVNFN